MQIESNEPTIIRKIAWSTTVPHLTILLSLIVFAWIIFLPDDFIRGSMFGALLYLIYSKGSKSLFLRHHQRGIYQIRLGSFQEAIASFTLSYEFLNRHRWLDHYRWVTLLDASAISYREMALVNIAYARAQLHGDIASLADYRRALDEFPDSELARAGIEHSKSSKH